MDKDIPLIYAVYSGGDDLFLIGPWDIMPDLAVQINQDFKQYTGNHPLLHLSAGMAFIDGKYPVYQAAEDAGDALETAKSMQGKNRFTFLDRPWTWTEFSALAGQQQWLSELVTRKNSASRAPSALLMMLRELAEKAEEHKRKDERVLYGPWIWQGEYLMARLQERQPKLAGDIQKLRSEMHDAEFRNIDVWGVAARWAQIRTREK